MAQLYSGESASRVVAKPLRAMNAGTKASQWPSHSVSLMVGAHGTARVHTRLTKARSGSVTA